MTKVYVMSTCPDCMQVKAQLANHPDYELIDIGEHVRYLKAFLRLRDSHPAFDAIKARGAVGIPCSLMSRAMSVSMPTPSVPPPKHPRLRR